MAQLPRRPAPRRSPRTPPRRRRPNSIRSPRKSSPTSPRLAGRSDARDDTAGAIAYYTENKGEAIWISKEGFNHKAQKAIHEIRNANEWGLDASAFQIPSNPGASAHLEAQAEAEIKLSLAVLKYARHARGGRLDPTSISPIIDRRPHIYDPKSVLEGISAADSADAYLRGLHPKHEQFKRLRQAYLALGKGPGGAGSSEDGSSSDGSSSDVPPERRGWEQHIRQ